MNNLSKRQILLISDLLGTFDFYYDNTRYVTEAGFIKYEFNGITFKISEFDYEKVCEIIDYIKGGNTNGN